MKRAAGQCGETTAPHQHQHQQRHPHRQQQQQQVAGLPGFNAGAALALGSNPFFNLPPLVPAGDASSATQPRVPVTLLPQTLPPGAGGLQLPNFGVGGLPTLVGGTSTLAIVNGVPVMLDLAKLVELMQMGASLSMVQPTPDMVNNAAAWSAAAAMGAATATKIEAKPPSPGLDDNEGDDVLGEGQLSPSLTGERGLIESVWNRRIGELQAFRDRFGHTDVKRGGEQWESLARWLDNLRKRWARREGSIPPDKALVLRQFGVEPHQDREDRLIGEVHRERKRNGMSDEDRWEVRIQQIAEFKRAHGHLKIPKNSQSALYYWAYGAKKKWRKYKDKRQRDLVHIGLISAEEYEAERRSKQGSTESSSHTSYQQHHQAPPSEQPQLPRPILSSPFASSAFSAPSVTPSPSLSPYRATSDDQRGVERHDRGGVTSAPPVPLATSVTPTAPSSSRTEQHISPSQSGLLHLGLIGEEEYEREVGHRDGGSNTTTTTPTTTTTSTPVRILPAIKPELSKPNSSGGETTRAEVDQKLKDLVELGLLSRDEYERQRSRAAPHMGASLSADTRTAKPLALDHKRKSAGDQLPIIVVHDNDASVERPKRIKRGRVSSFNELLVHRYDADVAATGHRDERSDGETPLAGGSPDVDDLSMTRSVKDEQRWHQRLQQMNDFLAKHGHFNVPRSFNSQLYYWAYGAKRKWREWSMDKQRDLVQLGLIAREEFEAHTGRKWDDVVAMPRASETATSGSPKRRRLSPECSLAAHGGRAEERDEFSRHMSSVGAEDEDEWDEREEDDMDSDDHDASPAFDAEAGEVSPSRAIARKRRRRERSRSSSADDAAALQRKNTSEEGLEEYRRRAFGGTDEERWAMRIRELQKLEEQEGTWCVPRRWSKSLKRWLEYMKLRWRSGRLTEKQIADLTTIGIIKDNRFYGIRDKRELDRIDNAAAKGGEIAGADTTTSPSSTQTRTRTSDAVSGSEEEDEEESSRQRSRGQWRHRALPPLSALLDQRAVDDNTAAPKDRADDAVTATAAVSSHEAKVIPITMTAAEAQSAASSLEADVPSRRGEEEDRSLAAAQLLRRQELEQQQQQQKQEAAKLLEKETVVAEEMEKEETRDSAVKDTSLDNSNDDEQDSLEIAEDEGGGGGGGGGGNDDDDEGEQDSDTIANNNGSGSSSNANDNVEDEEEDKEGEKEVGLLYEIETEEEWKKLTKDQRRRRRMAQLHQFFAEFGHGNVQHQWPKNKRLANWVYEQKQRWRKGLLSEAEVQEFEDLKMRKPRPGFGRPPKRRGGGSGGPDDDALSPDASDHQPPLKARKKGARDSSRTAATAASKSSPVSPADDRSSEDTARRPRSRSKPSPIVSAPPAPPPVAAAVAAAAGMGKVRIPLPPSPPPKMPLMSTPAVPIAQRLPPPASILSYLAPLNHLLPPIIFPNSAPAAAAAAATPTKSAFAPAPGLDDATKSKNLNNRD